MCYVTQMHLHVNHFPYRMYGQGLIPDMYTPSPLIENEGTYKSYNNIMQMKKNDENIIQNAT